MSNRLTPYGELVALLDMLPRLLVEARRARGLSQDAAAKEMGVTGKTIQRVEGGQGCHVDTATIVLRWLDIRTTGRANA